MYCVSKESVLFAKRSSLLRTGRAERGLIFENLLRLSFTFKRIDPPKSRKLKKDGADLGLCICVPATMELRYKIP